MASSAGCLGSDEEAWRDDFRRGLEGTSPSGVAGLSEFTVPAATLELAGPGSQCELSVNEFLLDPDSSNGLTLPADLVPRTAPVCAVDFSESALDLEHSTAL